MRPGKLDRESGWQLSTVQRELWKPDLPSDIVVVSPLKSPSNQTLPPHLSIRWGETRTPYCTEDPCLKCIKQACEMMVLRNNFSAIELACGYGDLLQYIHLWYPEAQLLGVDIRDYSNYFLSRGIPFRQEDLLDYIQSEEGQSSTWDLLLMINSYRGAMDDKSRLELHNWIFGHTRYFLVDLPLGKTPSIPMTLIDAFPTRGKGTMNLYLWKEDDDERIGDTGTTE